MFKVFLFNIVVLIGIIIGNFTSEKEGDTLESNNGTLQKSDITVEYIAHSSFKIQYKNKTILVDPYADKVWIGYNFPPAVQVDAIFSTHPHYDHDGGKFIGRTPYWDSEEMPFYQDPGVYTIGEIKVTGIVGKHSDPYGTEFGQKNTIWIFEIGGIKLAHLGDNGPLTVQNYKELGDIDILMVPIDSHFHILKEKELNIVLDKIAPKVIIMGLSI